MKFQGAKLDRAFAIACMLLGAAMWSTVKPAPGLAFSTPPEIAGESFSGVTARGARLTASLTSNVLPGSYRYEYSTSPLSQNIEILDTPEHVYHSSPVEASAQILELAPSTLYYFRVVAINDQNESAVGTEMTFWTLPLQFIGLPDSRTFEMVTPAMNNDNDVHTPLAWGLGSLSEGTNTELPFRASTEGDAVTYISDPSSGGFGSGGNGLGNQYIAQRLQTGAWSQTGIQPSGRRGTYYRGFSSDLSKGVLVSGGEGEPRLPPLSLQAPGEGYNLLYSCAIGRGACDTPEEEPPLTNPYRPLFGKPLNRSPRTFRARENGHQVFVANSIRASGAVFAGGSQEFKSMLFEANDALPGIEGPTGQELDVKVQQEITNEENNDHLYDLSEGHLTVVDILPAAEGGGISSGATFGAPPFPSLPAVDEPNFSNVISPDGQRVLWTDLTTDKVYIRIDGTHTLPVSEGAAQYWTSAANDRYVFYTEGEDLYRFDLEAATPTETHKVLAGPGSGVLGVIEASNDGNDVYFVAQGVLGSGVNGENIAAVTGQPNLYLSRDGGTPVFIATLSNLDGSEIPPFDEAVFSGKGEYGDWLPGYGQRPAGVSADGHAVVFMSNQQLPSAGFPEGYRNEGLEEVYLYDARDNSLHCISCSTSGERPADSQRGAAAFLPISWNETSRPRWVSEDGTRVFFDSVAPLVEQDTNGTVDVYEWEREGVGSCTEGSGVDGGCVYLLSGGASPSASWLLDASASGGDTFVITRAQLSNADRNESYDVYDARIGGAEPVPPPFCSGRKCSTVPASSPVFEAPASGTFAGSGNFSLSTGKAGTQKKHKRKRPRSTPKALERTIRACRKLSARHARTSCVARARKRYGHVSTILNAPNAKGK